MKRKITKNLICVGVIILFAIGVLAFSARPVFAVNTQWYVYTPGTETVSYVDFMDTNACGAESDSIDAYSYAGNVDSGNNLCVDFVAANVPSASSTADQVFDYGSHTPVLMSPYKVLTTSGTQINTTNGIRIAIATSTVNMRWATTSPYIDSPSCSVTGGIGVVNCVGISSSNFEGGDSVLVIPVTTNFGSGVTLTVSNLYFKDFASSTAHLPGLKLFKDGANDQAATGNEIDARTKAIKGLLQKPLADVQQANRFAAGDPSLSGSSLFSFKIAPFGENITITKITIGLQVRGIISADITQPTIYIDYNSNGVVDAGETTQVGGAGAPTISGNTGTLVFNDDFIATTTRNYILTADILNIGPSDEIGFSLVPSGIESTNGGCSSNQTITADTSGQREWAYHINIFGSGGGGGSIPLGLSAAPPSTATTTGGTAEAPGEMIGDEPGFKAPSNSNFSKNQWTDDSYAFASDESRAYSAVYNNLEDYGDFSFDIPGNVTIDGIEVKLEAQSSPAGGTIGVELGYNSGNSTTTVSTTTPVLTTSDVVYKMGGPTYTWGRTWSVDDLSNTNFRVRVQSKTSGGNTIYLDAIQAKVHYHAGGCVTDCGEGGEDGGLIYLPVKNKTLLANLYEVLSETLNELAGILTRWIRG